jgi:hypothetical protein
MTRFLHHRPVQSILNGPTHFEALIYIHAINAETPTCLGETNVLTVEGNANIAPLILGLSSLQYPDTVSWLIAAAVVLPFEAPVEAGALSHISEESLEIIDPLRADSDAASAVSVIFRVSFQEASRLHRLPTDIGRAFGPAVCSALGCAVFATKAPATCRVTSRSSVDSGDVLISAVAAKEPELILISALNEAKGGETPESEAGVILAHAALLPNCMRGGNGHD